MRLPPINSLVTFEAAGTHLSFTAAARELNVTREAVSMQVRLLEGVLGVQLFKRQQRGVELTQRGRALHARVSLALRQISEACSNVMSEKENSIVATTSIAFGSCWLLPRLPDFQRKHPDIKVRLLETDECIDLLHHDVDLGIRYGKGRWRRLSSTPLFNEEFFPVCTRTYADAHGVDSVELLRNATLLHLNGEVHAWEDWAKWFELAGAKFDMPPRGIWFQNYDNLLKAALNGQGVALGWTRLVEESLENGNLICPVERRFSTGNGYYLVENPASVPSEAQNAFKDWLFSFAPPIGAKSEPGS